MLNYLNPRGNHSSRKPLLVVCELTKWSSLDKSTQTEIKCLDVTNLVQTPTEEGGKATFFGNAEVKVGTGEEATTHQVTYRIDVDDFAESGKGKDTFKIQTDSGYAAVGVLQGENIQIHSQ